MFSIHFCTRSIAPSCCSTTWYFARQQDHILRSLTSKDTGRTARVRRAPSSCFFSHSYFEKVWLRIHFLWARTWTEEGALLSTMNAICFASKGKDSFLDARARYYFCSRVEMACSRAERIEPDWKRPPRNGRRKRVDVPCSPENLQRNTKKRF